VWIVRSVALVLIVVTRTEKVLSPSYGAAADAPPRFVSFVAKKASLVDKKAFAPNESLDALSERLCSPSQSSQRVVAGGAARKCDPRPTGGGARDASPAR